LLHKALKETIKRDSFTPGLHHQPINVPTAGAQAFLMD
jgi:hypothetical protein